MANVSVNCRSFDDGMGLKVSLTVTESSYSVTGNYSTVFYSWTAIHTGKYFVGNSRPNGANINIYIDGTCRQTRGVPLTNGILDGNTVGNGSGSCTVYHNGDGQKIVPFQIKVGKGNGAANGYEWGSDPYVYHGADSPVGNLALSYSPSVPSRGGGYETLLQDTDDSLLVI